MLIQCYSHLILSVIVLKNDSFGVEQYVDTCVLM